ncbi:MAG: holo-[acyl-carrier protein] synthase [Thermosediminibacterales bacterium]|nr:holo-[acyl-carrier protein] synthase [Thermosediminibacterales bacterium]MDK2836803.1 holo-[acyl-carrier protein] synthase [Thermosediminibacterales bacterium]
MIRGIGVDIIEISRIKKAMKKRQRFLTRFFREEEVEYIISPKNSEERAAGKFAAKEAVVKALGKGFSGFKWKEIQIVNSPDGKPEVKLFGKALNYAKKTGIAEIKVTVSHSREYAVAFAIAMGPH